MESQADTWLDHLSTGAGLFNEKNYLAAIDAFNKSIALNEHWNNYQGLGWALLHTNNYLEAIDAFNKSISLNEHWESYQGLAWALLHTSNYSAAIDAFNKSIGLSANWDTYRGLGWALMRTNNNSAALDAIINSYSMNQSKQAEKLLYKIYLRGGNGINHDKSLTSFLEYSINNNNQSAEIYLKNYIFRSSKSTKLSTLFLRYASLKIRKKIKKSTLPAEREVLDNLREGSISVESDLSGVSGFHRYVFGVSHSDLHRASPNTTVIRCGAGTMFSIGDPNSRTKHFQAINSEVEHINPKNSILVFEFGEVDIRGHIFKIAKRKSQSIYSIADISISRYIEFIKSLQSKGFYVLISGPHCGGGEHPSTTTAVERNDLCAYINDALNLECRAHKFYFSTLFDLVVNQKTLREMPGLYYDHNHLCLPPSKIGTALNAILNQRINGAFSRVISPYQSLQQEEVHTKCMLVISDIPNWQTGTSFDPGREIPSAREHFEVGQYMLLIELPFLMHPKEITLEFKQAALNIKTAVQGVMELWDISKETQTGNIINSFLEQKNRTSTDKSISHSFALKNKHDEMCKFLIVRISSSAIGNHLATIRIKRWIHQFQEKRLQAIC